MSTTRQKILIDQLRARYTTLAPTLQLAAKYVIDHPIDFAIDPIRKTSEKIGVSTYSLVRLAREFDFDGFEEFRAPFRHALRKSSQISTQMSWLDELAQSGDTGLAICASAENSLSIVSNSLQSISPEVSAEFIDRITQARTVYVTATRASYSLASYFHHVARFILPQVQLIPRDMGNPIDDLNFATSQDLLLAITVKPYSEITVNACKFARKKGMGLAIITDSHLPLAELSPDVVFTAQMDSPNEHACYSGLMVILEALLNLLINAGGDTARKNIKSYQDLKAKTEGTLPF